MECAAKSMKVKLVCREMKKVIKANFPGKKVNSIANLQRK